MAPYADNGIFTELFVGANLSYILRDNGLFLPTEYKVLQSQGSVHFAKCMKMQYNGCLQLLYLTGEGRSLAALLPTLNADSFMTVAADLIQSILQVKTNGFLSCCNTDIRFDRIYVDPATLRVRLIYLPLPRHLYPDTHSFEQELRSSLLRAMSGSPLLATPRVEKFAGRLADDTLKLEELLTDKPEHAEGDGQVDRAGSLSIVAMNAPGRVELSITKDVYVIGKNSGSVDGVLSFNPAISRVHCKIEKKEGAYYVQDMGSANGTFLNKIRLAKGEACRLSDGDILCLANSDFQVKLR